MSLGVVVMILIIFSFFLLYFQINTINSRIRKDVFYASNNIIIAMDKNELAFSNYELSLSRAKEIVEDLLKKNNIKENGYITDIKVEDVSYNLSTKKLNIKTKVCFKPVVRINDKDLTLFITEETKISLLQYS